MRGVRKEQKAYATALIGSKFVSFNGLNIYMMYGCKIKRNTIFSVHETFGLGSRADSFWETFSKHMSRQKQSWKLRFS